MDIFMILNIFLLFFAVFMNFFIFYKTREIYDLTEHKGIKYFRLAFLFFLFGSIWYLIKIFIEIDFFRFGVFFNIVALSYIILSLFHKKFNDRFEFTIYILAFILILLENIFDTKYYYLFIISIYFFIIGFFSIKRLLKPKKKTIFRAIYLIYLSLSGYWILKYIQIFLFFDSKYFDTLALLFLSIIYLFAGYIICKTLRGK